MAALADPTRVGSEDSSDEDEPISTTPGTNAVTTIGSNGLRAKRDELSRAWMDAEEEDEEEEDAEWSQLQAAVSAAAAAVVPAIAAASAAAAAAGSGTGTAATATTLPTIDDSNRSPRFKRLWAAIEKDQWNTDAWTALMGEVQTLPMNDARSYYERFLELFPTSGRWWKLYAEHELREKNFDHVQEIIKKSLMQLRCPHMELWLFYLTFTKVVQVDVAVAGHDEAAIKTARQLMCDAYELAVERVGGSLYATALWQSYISFLQEDTDPQAFLTVRKVFHRALLVPLLNMDQIWRDYERFERAIPNNDALAQNFFKVFRQKFDAARAVLRERKKLYDAVNLQVLAAPVSKKTMRTDFAQINEWQKILAFENGNPERLDSARWKSRMRYTYELFLGVHRHSPEAWFQVAAFENESNDPDAATAVFERAIEAIPDSSYLQFAFADHYELRGNIAAARATYEQLLEKHVSSLAYITYQRFARRALGSKGIKEARAIFRRARKDTRFGACTYHVYAAAAMLEFYSDTSDAGREIALKIFELGLKKFIHEPHYVLCYLDFLGHLNDDNNMRSLFEKVLAVMPAEVSRPIWDRYVAFEHTMVANGGDLATVAKIEARRALAFPDAPHVQVKGLLAVQHRYAFLDLRPPSSSDQMCLDKYGVGRRADSDATFGAWQPAGPDTNEADGSTLEADGTIAIDDRLIPGPPLPDFLKEFAVLLPLHQPWNGPVADVEHTFRAMLLVDFPPRVQIEMLQQQRAMQQGIMAQQQQFQQQNAELRTGNGANADAIAVNVVNKRPANDIFRSRQKQKLAKMG